MADQKQEDNALAKGFDLLENVLIAVLAFSLGWYMRGEQSRLPRIEVNPSPEVQRPPIVPPPEPMPASPQPF